MMRFWLEMGVEMVSARCDSLSRRAGGDVLRNFPEILALLKELRGKLESTVPGKDAPCRGQPMAG